MPIKKFAFLPMLNSRSVLCESFHVRQHLRPVVLRDFVWREPRSRVRRGRGRLPPRARARRGGHSEGARPPEPGVLAPPPPTPAIPPPPTPLPPVPGPA